MIQSLLTKETPEIIRFFRNIGSLSEMLDKQEEKLRPVLNGERYITDFTILHFKILHLPSTDKNQTILFA